MACWTMKFCWRTRVRCSEKAGASPHGLNLLGCSSQNGPNHLARQTPRSQQVEQCRGCEVLKGATMHLARGWRCEANCFTTPKSKRSTAMTPLSMGMLYLIHVFPPEDRWRNRRIATHLLLPPLQGTADIKTSLTKKGSELKPSQKLQAVTIALVKDHVSHAGRKRSTEEQLKVI